jgi:hypothetical protein
MKRTRLTDAFDGFVEYVLEGDDTAPHVFIGPIVWKLVGKTKRWYFSVVSGDANDFRIDAIEADEKHLVEAARNTVYAKFIARKPIVLHDFDDELEMARWTHAVWPSERAKKIVGAMETERTQWAAERA